MGRLTGLQSPARVIQRRVGFDERPLRLSASDCLVVRGILCGRLRVLAAVHGVAERQSIVAIGDGLARLLQGILGRDEFVMRVLGRAGCARGVDRALRLLHLVFGGIVAAGRRQEREDQNAWKKKATGRWHSGKYTSPHEFQRAVVR